MAEIKNKQSLIGKVVSTKMDNTVSVEVTRLVAHPVYKKRIKKHKKNLDNLNANITVKEQPLMITNWKKVYLQEKTRILILKKKWIQNKWLKNLMKMLIQKTSYKMHKLIKTKIIIMSPISSRPNFPHPRKSLNSIQGNNELRIKHITYFKRCQVHNADFRTATKATLFNMRM